MNSGNVSPEVIACIYRNGGLTGIKVKVSFKPIKFNGLCNDWLQLTKSPKEQFMNCLGKNALIIQNGH
jgi:hypothetical protein